jgi:hypothetical protein
MKTNGGFLPILCALGLLACGSDGAEDNTNPDPTADGGDSTSDEPTETEPTETEPTETEPTETEPTETEPMEDDDGPSDAGDDSAVDAGGDTVGDASPAGDASTGEGPESDAATDSGTMDSGAADPGDASGDDSGALSTEEDSGSADSGSPNGCANPAEVGTFAPPDGDAEGFVIDGARAYVAATSAGVYVVDLSDPALPVDIGQYDFPPGELVFRVASMGSMVAAGMRGNGWALLDVSDVEDIVLLSQDDAVSAEDIALAEGVLYYSDGDGVGSFDISDPSSPSPLSTDLVLPGSSKQMIVDGDRIYVATLGAGVSIVDASDPSALSELGSLDIGSVGAAHIALAGSTLYASHSEGVTVVDVSDPEAPTAIGEFVRQRAHALTVQGDRLFVFGDDTTTSDVPFLSVANVSDPTSPVDENVGLSAFEAPVYAAVSGEWLAVSVEDDDSLHLYTACPAP